MRESVFDTVVGRMTINNSLKSMLVSYLIKNPGYFLDDQKTTQIFQTKPLVRTPISELFEGLVENDIAKDFSLIRIPRRESSVPEVLTMRHIPFDMKQLAHSSESISSALKVMPNLQDKIVLNMTPLTQENLSFSDLAGFQSTVVRDALSRSYFSSQKTTWLSPSLSQFSCKVYSMTLGTAVAQWFDLDFRMKSFITVMFAYYYLLKVTDVRNAQGILKTKYRYFFIPDQTYCQQVFGMVEDHFHKETLDTLDEVCELIRNLGVQRIVLNRAILTSTKLKTLGPDDYTSALALEYPPYFVYLILLVASGSKISLSFRLKDLSLTRDLHEFVSDLSKTSALLGQF